MFEKEAEEYIHKDGTESEKLLKTMDLSLTKIQAFVLINVCKQCFKDGAEFGYNKAKEEMQKNGLALQSDMDKTIEQNIVLKTQIEKLKCCEMCKHKNLNWGFSPICEARNNIKIENPLTCKCDKWEIKEK